MLVRYCPNCETETWVEEHEREEVYSVRGESIPVRARVLVCHRCGRDLFDYERDEEILRRAYDEYRRRHGFLFPDDIRRLRERYGLSQRQLARLLGWGLVTVQRYEKGALQDKAHDLLLRQLENPRFVLRLVDSQQAQLSKREREEIRARVSEELGESTVRAFVDLLEEMLRKRAERNPVLSGFRPFDLVRFGQAVQAIVTRVGSPVFKTKLAKLLWLSDFLHFAESTVSITGALYACLPYGPAPDGYLWLLGCLQELGMIDVQVEEVCDYEGDTIWVAGSSEESALGAKELSAIERVVSSYGGLSAAKLSELSHRERAWAERSKGDIIPYTEALDLELIRRLRTRTD